MKFKYKTDLVSDISQSKTSNLARDFEVSPLDQQLKIFFSLLKGLYHTFPCYYNSLNNS